MIIPKMILFDYGQTLVNERQFDGIKELIEEIMNYRAKAIAGLQLVCPQKKLSEE